MHPLALAFIDYYFVVLSKKIIDNPILSLLVDSGSNLSESEFPRPPAELKPARYPNVKHTQPYPMEPGLYWF
jgi:hypothetical protein